MPEDEGNIRLFDMKYYKMLRKPCNTRAVLTFTVSLTASTNNRGFQTAAVSQGKGEDPRSSCQTVQHVASFSHYNDRT